jgi:ComEC/Rec2-related protein
MYKLILVYLLGIVVAVGLNPDRYFFITIFLVSFITHMSFMISKGQMSFRNVLYKTLNLAVLFLVFFLSVVYTKHKLLDVSYKTFSSHLLQIQTEIAEVKQHGINKIAVLEVKKVEDVENNLSIKSYPKYVEISVSPFTQLEKFDELNLMGTFEFQNFNVYNEMDPLFYSYQFENLFYNTPYSVSQIKKFELKSREKKFWETFLIHFDKWSDFVKNKIDEHMVEPYAQVAKGISVGDQENLQKDIKDIFRTSGLIHILVLSGANVSFIISILWFLVRRLNNRTKVLMALSFSWIFIFFTGLTSPSVRAGVMSSTNILGEYFGKNLSTFRSLLLALFVLTILNPLALIFSPSLHLSFLACFGLFVIAPRIGGKVLVSSFIGLSLTTIPYILGLTGSSSLFGTLLTFLIEPVAWAVMILTFLIILVSLPNLFPTNLVADFFGIINSFLVKIILMVANFGGTYLPQLSIHIGPNTLIIYFTFLLIIFSKDDLVGEWYNIEKNESRA